MYINILELKYLTNFEIAITVIKVPKCCGCFTISVEYVSGLVDDPAGVPAPLINIQNGNLTIDGKVA